MKRNGYQQERLGIRLGKVVCVNPTWEKKFKFLGACVEKRNRTIAPIQPIGPVSYTHLDVYKRQFDDIQTALKRYLQHQLRVLINFAHSPKAIPS